MSINELNKEYFRPWGSYICLDQGSGYQVKRLNVIPGGILSLQRHFRRAEHWTVVSGTARITLDEKVFDLTVNESVFIPLKSVHRIANHGIVDMQIIEVQCGDYLGEDDIERLEDHYGRIEENDD